ncbi:hypothetical protein PENTCL1PPCAC_24788 [Pristionchus entomophagus]|uniref:U4/U6.U5 small nuclear ribonucleoprotein 27 kDa protein n=1 Tax=Pristionchus entomophagus TaxID=358040 RepID=A0AAV5U707_9BILA|nr:hypothetical protein PENTCL1PPCAC_24788 [Pristionchus entomophagus]
MARSRSRSPVDRRRRSRSPRRVERRERSERSKSRERRDDRDRERSRRDRSRERRDKTPEKRVFKEKRDERSEREGDRRRDEKRVDEKSERRGDRGERKRTRSGSAEEAAPVDITSVAGIEDEVAKMMGFGGFETTKNKKVDGNDVGEVKINKQRRYRQYMNRKGGFNRPLDWIA